MSTWNVELDLSASTVVNVDADSREEAEQKALAITRISSIRMTTVDVYEIAGVVDAWEEDPEVE